ncbi:uncharacterized protein LOC111245499 isoform X6 [Varroa destructor]|uniref:Uncharacterized protein n=1 Tax=Varroa destructor TaxID=109461 RepID=A0A7M7JC22_VARDE|nr:uncharacterized protein LOC111245499 isoform X6 [Varroa destructor]
MRGKLCHTHLNTPLNAKNVVIGERVQPKKTNQHNPTLNFGLDYLGAPGVSQGDPSFAGKLNLPRIIATSPAVPVAKGPELVVIFRKMGTDLPKRLAKNERALSARKNSLGEFGVLKPTVQESFDAGFIQAYKLIAQCIDQASLMHRSIDDDQHEKHLTASSINEVLKSDHTGEFIQQILENVLTPLKEILDDPEADGVELALDTVEAAMSEASRGTYVEARDEPNDPLFERRARPSLWELERQFRRGAKDAYNQIIVEAFNDEAELDLKELVDNICELVSIYQMGVKRLLESNVT